MLASIVQTLVTFSASFAAYTIDTTVALVEKGEASGKLLQLSTIPFLYPPATMSVKLLALDLKAVMTSEYRGCPC